VEERVAYLEQRLLKPDANHVTLEECQESSDGLRATNDWAQLERMLIPLLNHVRKVQGKKPIVVPR